MTEKVKKFIEDYNALVKAINTQITTKPDKSYGPLSDAHFLNQTPVRIVVQVTITCRILLQSVANNRRQSAI